ncbi:hypothetical protein DSM25559_4942 [Agrobacterium rosae]|uniref:Uncharacterized protein n=1 Tax=Agrobacterium rosae TaxID=1972867 RepID=A0A1R3U222_9HYPH|nr:hypothetical protein DSM25559_4942 [Agrobacterium rosae]
MKNLGIALIAVLAAASTTVADAQSWVMTPILQIRRIAAQALATCRHAVTSTRLALLAIMATMVRPMRTLMPPTCGTRSPDTTPLADPIGSAGNISDRHAAHWRRAGATGRTAPRRVDPKQVMGFPRCGHFPIVS